MPYNEKRYAPKLLTKNAYGPGTVWVMDAVHMPYGCSVWPALWTQGPNWPEGGEIDIMEGVHLQKTNQVALHSEGDGCYASKDVSMTGSLAYENCSISSNSASGCIVTDPNTNSYGADFASAGGGVYVAEFADQYIKVWFLTRSAVPEGVTKDAKSIDTASLGEPLAYYPRTTCDFPKYFGEQTLTIDITLCGTWGSIPSVLEATCPTLAENQTCYTTYVINDASETYANAFFELNYINIYSNASSTGTETSTSAAGTKIGTGTATGTATGTKSGSGTGTTVTSTSVAPNAASRAATYGTALALIGAVVALAI